MLFIMLLQGTSGFCFVLKAVLEAVWDGQKTDIPINGTEQQALKQTQET